MCNGKNNNIICGCCRKRKATLKDYRIVDGISGKVLVCKSCFSLNDVEFYKQYIKGVV